MTQNPNWPLIEEAVSLDSSPTNTSNRWLSITERTIDKSSTRRGRSYETDQNQTGEATLAIQNTDGAFDPSNTSSPYYPQVKLYRGYRKRAQLPATVNLLTTAQATAGTQPNDDGSTVTAPAMPLYVDNGGGPYATATTGSGTYVTSLPASPTSGSNILKLSGWAAAPGVAFSAQVRAASTVSISMRLRIVWWDASGGVISSNPGSPATVTTTTAVTVANIVAPANVAGGTLELYINSSPGSSAMVTVSLPQLERNTTTTTYAQPSRWYPIFTGYVERWPQTWTRNGTYGRIDLTCVDIYGWLSQRPLHSPAYMEILGTEPSNLSFLYCLDEASGSSQFLDATGQQQPIAFADRGPGVTGFTAAAGATLATVAGTVTPYGIGGPVAQIAQPATGTGSVVLPLQDTANTWPPVGSAWTRLFAVNPSATSAGGNVVVWQVAPNLPLSQSAVLGPTFIEVFAGSSGAGHAVLAVSRAGSILVNSYSSSSPIIIDGGWHMIAVTMTADGKTIQMYTDGVLAVTYTDASSMTFTPMNGVDLLGTSAPTNSIQYSCLAQWTTVLGTDEIAAIWSSFNSGGSGNGSATSASRWNDILRWAQYKGPQAADNFTTGQTNRYGPGTELNATRASPGIDVVSTLQTVVDTETGAGYVAASGAVTLKARRARYNQNTPVVTFGENVAGGEVPYNPLGLTLDPSRLANDAQLTQTLTSDVTRYFDTSGDLGNVQIQRTLNSLDLYEISDAAHFLVGRYKSPAQRVETVTVPVSSFTNPAASTAAWAACLALELGSRVRVNRRPSGASLITFDGFIESIAWSINDKGGASVDLEMSPASGYSYWIVGSATLTLKTAVTSVGQTTCVINPMSDSATNPIQANISRAGNTYEWLIDRGLSTEELVTVTSPVAGSTGYTSATLNIGVCQRTDTGATGTGFRFTHAINAVIQDIGGYVNEPTFTQPALDAILGSVSLNSYAVLDSTTIVGY